MPNPRQVRAAIGEEFQADLEELRNYLGHASISQTIEFILRSHLAAELRLAKNYSEQRLGLVKTPKKRSSQTKTPKTP